MGISHFSGLFVLLCVGVGGALLTLAGEHGFYRLVLPHIRRRKNLKYWLHTSQKIHRALNMTYEDVKRQRAERDKSCNLHRSPPPAAPPGPAAPAASAKRNNESNMDVTAAAAAAAAQDGRDFRRVHFNLETLNTRRLLARLAASDAKTGGARENVEREGPAKLRSESSARGFENGGPAASLASLVLSLPSSSSSTRPTTSTNAAPPPTTLAPPSAPAALPRPGELQELQELQEQIDQMRDSLRTALARRAELQTTLGKPVTAVAANNPSCVPTTTSMSVAPLTTAGPPAVTTVTPLPANTKCVTTMTDPPHKVLSKVRTLPSRPTNERR